MQRAFTFNKSFYLSRRVTLSTACLRLKELLPDELEILLIAPLDYVRLVVPVLPGAVRVHVSVDAGSRRQRHLGGQRGRGGGGEGGGRRRRDRRRFLHLRHPMGRKWQTMAVGGVTALQSKQRSRRSRRGTAPIPSFLGVGARLASSWDTRHTPDSPPTTTSSAHRSPPCAPTSCGA